MFFQCGGLRNKYNKVCGTRFDIPLYFWKMALNDCVIMVYGVRVGVKTMQWQERQDSEDPKLPLEVQLAVATVTWGIIKVNPPQRIFLGESG
ncbi:hypothetical protein JTB14_025432 [Gonioctena quinquepunctata]|nr:hypothetical protein JTB14_025432 [Gonioctena quinquepunctata]